MILVQIPLIFADVFFVRINLTLLGAALLIQLFSAFNIAMLDCAVFPHLVVIPLSAGVGQLVLVFMKVALIGADVAVIV
ncbi:MAG: hypothetical protein WB610_11700, partial [Rhodomicrobium sp.]